MPYRCWNLSKPLEQPLWLLQAGSIAMAVGLLHLLPLRAALVLVGGVFALGGAYTSKAKKVRGSLAVAFPDRSPAQHAALLSSSFHYLGEALVELVHLGKIWRSHAHRIEFVLAEGARAPVAGQPAVIVSAHVGAWEMIPLIARYYGITMPIVYAPAKNPYIDRVLTRLRRANGCPLVTSQGAVRMLVRALKRGQCVGSVLDLRLDAGEPLPFFDEPAWTNTVPARLSLRHHCDLVPVKSERLPGARYRVTILPPIKARDAQAEAAEQARDMTRQVNQLFEEWIIESPGQWYCLKRRWPKATERNYRQRMGRS